MKIAPSMLLLLLLPVALLLTGMYAEAGEPVRHVVIFKYKAGTTDEQIEQVTQAFAALKEKIPGIVAFEYGVNDSPEGRNRGFTHVYLLTFESAAARDTYLPHPEHQKFGEWIGKMDVVEDVFVVDYSPVE